MLYGYVYAQTDRDIYNLVQAIKSETDKCRRATTQPFYVCVVRNTGRCPGTCAITIMRPFRAACPDASGPPEISQPIIIANVNQQSVLDGLPGWRALPQAFTLRPGVELFVYVRMTRNNIGGSPE